jgi:hypothetical protein
MNFHLLIDDVEYFRHRPAWSPEATDDFQVEAALALFPKKGEVGGAEGPAFIGHLASGKSRKLAL